MNLLQIDIPAVPVAFPDSIKSAATEINQLKSLSFDDLLSKLVNGVVDLSIKIAIAIVVFYLGKFIIMKLYRVVEAIMVKRKTDPSLTTFVLSLIKIVLYFILIVTVIGILGLETSSFLAIFASAGVAIGMALSGTLQNFAGGVLILLIKPYKIGDYIEAQGFAGTVTEIQIFHTIINTYDNKSIIIPNGGLSTGSINNWSREDYRRVEWQVAISYGDSVEKALEAILDIFEADSRIVKQYIEDDREQRLAEAEQASTGEASQPVEDKPESWWRRVFHLHRRHVRTAIDRINDDEAMRPNIVRKRVDRSPVVIVDALADSSINLKARAWVRSSDYWNVYYQINELIYNRLPEAGLHFPFPQLDVHLQS